MQAPGREAGRLGEGSPGRTPALSPKVMQQQLRPKEPGCLSLDFGGIWEDLCSWGDTGHSLPSRYRKGTSTDTEDMWECLYQGGSRANLFHASRATQTGRRLAV